MELLPTKALSGSGCQNACQSKPRRQRTEKKAKKRVQKDAESGPEKAARKWAEKMSQKFKKTTEITGHKMYVTSRGAPEHGHLGRNATQWRLLQRSSSIKFISMCGDG